MTQAGFARMFADIDSLPRIDAWRDRIPMGELTIMCAAGGTGKGMLCSYLAAAVSRGRPMPDNGPSSPAQSVLMASTEDDPNIVTVNRLKAHGADLRKIADISRVADSTISLPTHLSALRDAISSMKDCGLVILDPLAAIAEHGVGSVRNARQIFTPLQMIANDTGVPIVLTHHENKDGSVAGSQAVKDAVRSVLRLAKDELNPDIRALSVVKSNGADFPAPVRFRIVGEGPMARIDWLSASAEHPSSGMKALQAEIDLASGAKSAQELSHAVGLPYSQTRVLLERMIKRDKISQPYPGWYAKAARVSTTVSQ